MNIFIDEHSSIPNYKQIMIQIKKLIVKGELQPHDQLPSIRLLSKKLNVAIITVKRAYEELEKEGLTYTISGKGVYVQEIRAEQLRLDVIKNIKSKFRESLVLARYFRLTDEEILTLFKEELFNE